MTTISFRTGAVGLVLGPPLKVRRAPLLEGRRPQFLNPRSHHQRRRGYEDLAGSFLVDLTQPVSHQGLIDAGNGSPRTAYRHANVLEDSASARPEYQSCALNTHLRKSTN